MSASEGVEEHERKNELEEEMSRYKNQPLLRLQTPSDCDNYISSVLIMLSLLDQ